MSDIIELGLEASDKIVDEYWDHVPDKVFGITTGTKKHKNSSPSSRNGRRDNVKTRGEKSDSDSEEAVYNPYPDGDVRSRRFEHDQEMTYGTAQTRSSQRVSDRGFTQDAGPDRDYRRSSGPSSSRPRLQQRRSQSVQGRDNPKYARPSRPRSQSPLQLQSLKMRWLGTENGRALTSGIAGAAVGGLAARQIGKGKGDAMLMTLAGIVLGGLGGNALEHEFEKAKEKKEKKEKRDKRDKRSQSRDRKSEHRNQSSEVQDWDDGSGRYYENERDRNRGRGSGYE